MITKDWSFDKKLCTGCFKLNNDLNLRCEIVPKFKKQKCPCTDCLVKPVCEENVRRSYKKLKCKKLSIYFDLYYWWLSEMSVRKFKCYNEERQSVRN